MLSLFKKRADLFIAIASVIFATTFVLFGCCKKEDPVSAMIIKYDETRMATERKVDVSNYSGGRIKIMCDVDAEESKKQYVLAQNVGGFVALDCSSDEKTEKYTIRRKQKIK